MLIIYQHFLDLMKHESLKCHLFEPSIPALKQDAWPLCFFNPMHYELIISYLHLSDWSRIIRDGSIDLRIFVTPIQFMPRFWNDERAVELVFRCFLLHPAAFALLLPLLDCPQEYSSVFALDILDEMMQHSATRAHTAGWNYDMRLSLNRNKKCKWSDIWCIDNDKLDHLGNR